MHEAHESTTKPPEDQGGGMAGLSGLVPAADLSLRDFLTDASLAAACDGLGRLAGVAVWLRDRGGEAIIPGVQGEPWRIVTEETAARRAAEIAGVEFDPAGEVETATLGISTGVLGEIVAVWPRGGGAEGEAGAERRRALMGTLGRIASAISEGCEAQVSLRQRVHELGSLYRLSSMIVQTEDVDALLRVALDLAIDALRADAGSIALVEEGQDDLVMKASRGLSAEWVAGSARRSYASDIRRAALAGEVVCVRDLAEDGRMPDPSRVRGEGLAGLACTGMMYHGRSIGLLRLYTRAARRFTAAEQGLLRSIADQSAAAVVNARLRRVREENERVQRQVRLAADVQRRMLPKSTPESGQLDIAARYMPSFELGGDFYDFIPLGGHMGVAVGDVVGKGVAAALLMSAVRASLRAHAQDLYHLDEVLSRVNAALATDTRDDEFATLWYGVIDPVVLRLTYCNAGHNPPIVFHPRPGRAPSAADLFELEVGGMALGIDRLQLYERGQFDLTPGDVVVAYTDGLTDALNFSLDRFGKGRLKQAILEVLTADPRSSASAIVEHVLWSLRQFTGLKGRNDDITLVVVRVRERG